MSIPANGVRVSTLPLDCLNPRHLCRVFIIFLMFSARSAFWRASALRLLLCRYESVHDSLTRR